MTNRSFLLKLLYGGGVFFDLTKWVILAAVALVLINTFWITIFFVDGLSMEPNLHDKELVLLRKNGISGTYQPKRGDVVVVRYPGDPSRERYVKRVVGLPGETLEIKGSQVYINGSLLKEKYLSFAVETEPDGNWAMGEHEYYLMGDNRPNSNDSRYFGPVEKRFIIGKAIQILFPRIRSIG